MAESFALVSFENPAKTYPVNVEVKCSFTIKHPCEPSSYDWIGLFRVPWSSIKDKCTYQYIAMSSEWSDDADKPGSVVFPAANLPEEDGDYYQFVYFDSKGHMRGASSPFTFRQPHTHDLVEEVMSDDSDMLFITTRQTQLETQITDLQQENEKLQLRYDSMKGKNRDLLGQVEDLEERLQQEQTNITQSRERVLELEKELELSFTEAATTKRQLLELDTREDNLKQQIQQITAQKEMLEVQMNDLNNQVDMLTGESNGLRREKEMYVQHVTEADTSKQQLQEQMAKLQKKLDDQQHDQALSKDTLELQLAAANVNIEKKEKTITEQQEMIGVLTNQMEAASERHRMNAMELDSVRETLANLSTKYEEVSHVNSDLKHHHTQAVTELEAVHTKNTDLEDKLAQSKDANKLLSDELQRLTQQVEGNTMDQQRFLALTASYGMIKDELTAVRRSLEVRTAQEKQVRASERLAKQKVQDLQQRLKEGEREWKKVTKRNAELERKLAKSTAKPTITSFAAAFRRGGTDELTREELQQILTEMSQELEEVKAAKEKYKEKYLAEKQRIVTIKDDFKTEKETLELKLAQAQSLSAAAPSPLMDTTDGASGTNSNRYPPPIVYPPVLPLSQRIQPDPFITADVPALACFDEPPCPAEHGASGDENSDDEAIAERFHDAVDVAPLALDETPPESCCMCHTRFDSSYDEQKKTEHVNTHLMSLNPNSVDSALHYCCPMCPQMFKKDETNQEDFQNHVQEHFTDN